MFPIDVSLQLHMFHTINISIVTFPLVCNLLTITNDNQHLDLKSKGKK